MNYFKDMRPYDAKYFPTGKTFNEEGIAIMGDYGIILEVQEGCTVPVHSNLDLEIGKKYKVVISELQQHIRAKDEEGYWRKWVPSPEALMVYRVTKAIEL